MNEQKSTEIKITSVSQLKEHELQNELSPMMREKTWKSFVDGIRENGIKLPLIATKNGKIIDGKHRLRAAKELGISGVRVVFEDIPENELPSYISEAKLNRDDLTKGQRACIVLNRYEAEERAKARERQGQRNDITSLQNCKKVSKGGIHEILAKKVDISPRSMASLIAVKRKRPDLYAKVFEGFYAIGKAHSEMKADEKKTEHSEKEETTENIEVDEHVKKATDSIKKVAEKTPESLENESPFSPNNLLNHATKNEMPDISTKLIMTYKLLAKADEEIVSSHLEQITAIAETCLRILGRYESSETKQTIYDACLEMLLQSKDEEGVNKLQNIMEVVQ